MLREKGQCKNSGIVGEGQTSITAILSRCAFRFPHSGVCCALSLLCVRARAGAKGGIRGPERVQVRGEVQRPHTLPSRVRGMRGSGSFSGFVLLWPAALPGV